MPTLKVIVGSGSTTTVNTLSRAGYIPCESLEKLKECFKHSRNAVIYKGTALRSNRALWASIAPKEYIIDAIYLRDSKGVIEIPTEFEGFDSVRFV